MRFQPTPPFDTTDLLGITSVASFSAWILTWVFGFILYEPLPLGVLVIVLTVSWLLVTGSVGLYCVENTPDALKQLFVWRLWLWLSIGGIIINIGAGAVVALGIVTSEIPITTLPMEYGVILPWLVIYAIGYGLTAGYDWDNSSLSKPERVVYAVLALLSLIAAVALGYDPTLHGPMIFVAALLSAAPLLTLYWR